MWNPVTEIRTQLYIRLRVDLTWARGDEPEVMMCQIFFASSIRYRSYPIWSDIAEYRVHPDEIWLICIDGSGQSHPSPESKWSYIHEPYTSHSTRIPSISIYLYLFPDTTQRYGEIIYILFSTSYDTRIIRYEEYTIDSLCEASESIQPEVIGEPRNIEHWELSDI